MLRRAVAGAVAVVSFALLAGCGDDDGAIEPMPTVEEVPTPSDDRPGPGGALDDPSDDVSLLRPDRGGPGGTPSLDEEALGDLADLAEQSARDADDLARSGPVLGADVSWPQCPKGMGIPERRTLGLPAPPPEAQYVVVGLTNGPAFTENPCLADQVAAVEAAGQLLAAYAVTSYPDAEALETAGDDGPFDAGTASGRLANTGYQQAAYGVRLMQRDGLDTPVVWVDVEPVSDFEWSDDPDANAAVVRGVVRGYEDAGYEVGIYSTPYLWEQIVADLELGLPEWRAAGETSRAEALSRCRQEESIQGGEAVMGQWLQDSRDLNVTCPGVSAELGRWFADPR